MASDPSPAANTRDWVNRAFTILFDLLYLGLALLLGASAIVLLISGVISFAQSFDSKNFAVAAIALLDRILLILLIVELLYTVQISLREHALLPEPFLLVGLIAAIRRVLVLTAEFGHAGAHPPEAFQQFFIELAILTGLILAIAISLVLVHKGRAAPTAA